MPRESVVHGVPEPLELTIAPDERATLLGEHRPQASRCADGAFHRLGLAPRWSELKRRLVAENRLLKIAERSTWLDSKVIDEPPAGVLVGSESFGLATRTVKSKH